MSDNSSESKVVYLTANEEARDLIRWLAKPCPAGDKSKTAIRRAYQRIGSWTFNRVKDVWNADRRISVSGDELLQLQAAKRKREGTLHHAARLESAACALEAIDPDFHRPSIDQLRLAARDIRGAVDRNGRLNGGGRA